MSRPIKTQLHPLEKASTLESRLRRLLQNPKRILKGYIHQGMTVLDLGCGTGYFTIEIAKLLEGKGQVFAVDVQEGMLDLLCKKLDGNELSERVKIINNKEQDICFTEKVDFILAFYSFHEMEYIDHIIQALGAVIKPETRILIAEQKGHVSKELFERTIKKMENIGFVVCERPKIFLSRSVVMKHTTTSLKIS